MLATGSVLKNIPEALEGEQFQDLLRGQGFRVERIVSQGYCSPQGFWYQQVESEWVLVIEGAAKLLFEDGTVHAMTRGDYVLIPAGVRHRVEWTDPAHPTVWLAIHFPTSS